MVEAWSQGASSWPRGLAPCGSPSSCSLRKDGKTAVIHSCHWTSQDACCGLWSEDLLPGIVLSTVKSLISLSRASGTVRRGWRLGVGTEALRTVVEQLSLSQREAEFDRKLAGQPTARDVTSSCWKTAGSKANESLNSATLLL